MTTTERPGPTWHRIYPACLDCGGTEKPHVARGLCSTCANELRKPGYDGNAAPSQGRGGARLSEAERDEIAARAVARARERGWRPRHERTDTTEGDMKGWGGSYHACRDCGSDKRPHVADGLCTLCHMERSGHTPTALEAALLDGAEPPLARASGTTLPPDAPAPPPHILPSRGEADRRDNDAARRLHADSLPPALPRHRDTANPDATAPREEAPGAVVPLPEPEPEHPAGVFAPVDAPDGKPVAAIRAGQPAPVAAPLAREEVEYGDMVAPAPPPAPIPIALESIPTEQLVAELRRRQEAARRAYDDALAAMESLDLALDALNAPASARQLRGVA